MSVQKTEFKEVLKSWRGRMYQKEAADKISVGLRRYQSWERGVSVPDPIIQSEMYRRMGLQNG